MLLLNHSGSRVYHVRTRIPLFILTFLHRTKDFSSCFLSTIETYNNVNYKNEMQPRLERTVFGKKFVFLLHSSVVHLKYEPGNLIGCYERSVCSIYSAFVFSKASSKIRTDSSSYQRQPVHQCSSQCIISKSYGVSESKAALI